MGLSFRIISFNVEVIPLILVDGIKESCAYDFDLFTRHAGRIHGRIFYEDMVLGPCRAIQGEARTFALISSLVIVHLILVGQVFETNGGEKLNLAGACGTHDSDWSEFDGQCIVRFLVCNNLAWTYKWNGATSDHSWVNSCRIDINISPIDTISNGACCILINFHFDRKILVRVGSFKPIDFKPKRVELSDLSSQWGEVELQNLWRTGLQCTVYFKPVCDFRACWSWTNIPSWVVIIILVWGGDCQLKAHVSLPWVGVSCRWSHKDL